jgi:hypothetical protein
LLKVVEVHGGVSPRIDTKLLPSVTRTNSFTIELSGHEVKATPLPGMDLEPDQAVTRLHEEIRPLLAAASHLKETPILLVDTNPHWVDTNDPTGRVRRRPVGTGLSMAFIIAGPTTTSDVEQRVIWATQDGLYAELLELLAEARSAANPRVTGYVMVERIETALGSAKSKRPTGLAKLGLTEKDVRETVAYPSRFKDDRHGEHPVGSHRPPIDPKTRQIVLDELAGLVRAYEEHIFNTKLTT